MTPIQFEQLYESDWEELRTLLGRMDFRGWRKPQQPLQGERLAALYRRACEHLALARARSYPAYLIDRLEHITSAAHQAIYRHREFGIARLKQLIAVEIPRSVRAHAPYVWISIALFAIPTVGMGLLVYWRPDLILTVVDAATAAGYEDMYSSAADALGRTGGAQSDWAMFGFYVRNNITVAFQCFASGLFVGVGSIFYIAYNGLLGGAIAGYLTARGLGETFYSFVVTHSAFEITAIVLSGAGGLRIGHALLSPGRETRLQSLVNASRESVVMMYGAIGMLLIAAAIEAFWSSATWIPLPMKYSIAAVCWITVIVYLTRQGRRAD